MAGSKELLTVNEDGTQEWVHFDDDGNLLGVQHFNPDVQPVIDENKRRQNDGSRGYGETKEWRHVASIPVSVLYQYCADKGIPMEHAIGGPEQMVVIQKILKDHDYLYLRTISNVSIRLR